MSEEHIVTEDMLGRVLDLSTCHMPSNVPEWGKVRVVDHENGFTVYVMGGLDEEGIREHALETGACTFCD